MKGTFTLTHVLTLIIHENRSYGTVWKAQMRETGELLAIKKVPADSDPADLKREVEFMRGCQSPYIVRYFGSCEQKGELWVSQ